MTPAHPPLSSCLSVLRRTPPGDSAKDISDLACLLLPDEDSADNLFQLADPPLRISSEHQQEDKNKKLFILCDHNRDGDSFRSPWSNEYDPPLPDGGFRPSPRLRDLEKRANEVWDAYRAHYYSGGDGRRDGDTSVGSVYLWDKEDGNGSKGSVEAIGSALPSFAGAFLIRKDVQKSRQHGNVGEGQRKLEQGYWNSVHVVDVQPATTNGCALYQLTATINFSMSPADGTFPGRTDITGSLVRQMEKTLPVESNDDHIANIGCIIEDLEIDMRTHMDSLYLQKTREVIDSIRSSGSQDEKHSKAEGQQRVALMLTQAAMLRQQESLSKAPSGGRPTV